MIRTSMETLSALDAEVRKTDDVVLADQPTLLGPVMVAIELRLLRDAWRALDETFYEKKHLIEDIKDAEVAIRNLRDQLDDAYCEIDQAHLRYAALEDDFEALRTST